MIKKTDTVAFIFKLAANLLLEFYSSHVYSMWLINAKVEFHSNFYTVYKHRYAQRVHASTFVTCCITVSLHADLLPVYYCTISIIRYNALQKYSQDMFCSDRYPSIKICL